MRHGFQPQTVTDCDRLLLRFDLSLFRRDGVPWDLFAPRLNNEDWEWQHVTQHVTTIFWLSWLRSNYCDYSQFLNSDHSDDHSDLWITAWYSMTPPVKVLGSSPGYLHGDLKSSTKHTKSLKQLDAPITTDQNRIEPKTGHQGSTVDNSTTPGQLLIQAKLQCELMKKSTETYWNILVSPRQKHRNSDHLPVSVEISSQDKSFSGSDFSVLKLSWQTWGPRGTPWRIHCIVFNGWTCL